MSIVIGRADKEFLPAALEIIESPPSPVKLGLIWFITLLAMSTLAWSWFGQIDIHAVAQGRIQPSGRSKVVQPAEAGRVRIAYVRNGSSVREGDVLVELDSTDSGADLDAMRAEVETNQAEIARRRLAIASARSGEITAPVILFPDAISELVRRREQATLDAETQTLSMLQRGLDAQIGEREAQKQRLKFSIVERTKLVAVLTERVKMRQMLVDRDAGARAAVIDALQEQQKEAAILATERGQIFELDAAITTLRLKQNETTAQFITEQTQRLLEMERRFEKAQAELIKAVGKNNRTRLTAPVSGIVQQLALTTEGQVVAAGQPLMTIVPGDDRLEVEAFLQNKDVGFVAVGQKVILKIDAFPFTRFGTVEGEVVQVSRDAIDEREATGLADSSSSSRGNQNQSALSPAARIQNLVYPTTIALRQLAVNVGASDVRLQPGMAVTAEIRTGERRLLDYLLSPVREVSSQAAHER